MEEDSDEELEYADNNSGNACEFLRHANLLVHLRGYKSFTLTHVDKQHWDSVFFYQIWSLTL